MALDNAIKRASVSGAGRPYLRTIVPLAGKPERWRHMVGNTYAAFNFGEVVIVSAKWYPFQCNLRRRHT